MARNPYRRANIVMMSAKEISVRERQVLCKHEWRPWVYTKQDGSKCLLAFPGMRCPNCGKEQLCVSDGPNPEFLFKRKFRVSFGEFVKQERSLLEKELPVPFHRVAELDEYYLVQR